VNTFNHYRFKNKFSCKSSFRFTCIIRNHTHFRNCCRYFAWSKG